MKIQYASDLHLELYNNSRWIKNNPLSTVGDILILAGDIIYLGDNGGFDNPFWDWCADNFEHTLIVPGNHEYYGGFDLKDTLNCWSLNIRNNVKYCNNDVVRIGNTDIILSTLWSNIHVENALAVEFGINDFRRIRYDGELIDFVRFNETHKLSLDFVRNAVDNSESKHIIVVSHHLPSNILVSERFKGSRLNNAFVSEQGNWIAESKIDYWLYGHSHTNITGKINNTKFLSNQLGYVFHTPESSDFDARAFIEIK